MKNSIFLILLISSCSSKLSKEEAASIIKEQYPKFCNAPDYIKTRAYFYYDERPKAKERSAHDYFKFLESQKLVTLSEQKSGFTANPNRTYSIKMTEGAKKIYGSDFGISQIDFTEVTSISQTENQAIIRFNLTSKETPFYKLHRIYYEGKKNRKLRCIPDTWEEEITLVKFDTGWQVK